MVPASYGSLSDFSAKVAENAPDEMLQIARNFVIISCSNDGQLLIAPGSIEVVVTGMVMPAKLEQFLNKSTLMTCILPVSVTYWIDEALKESDSNSTPLTVAAIQVVLGIILGMRWLEGLKCIHGSIQPSRIMLTKKFEPKIAYFGPLEKKDGADAKYRAPEMACDMYYEKTDVYLVAMIIKEVLALGENKSVEIPIIEQCFAPIPDDRPFLHEIADELCSDLSDKEFEFVSKVQKGELSTHYRKSEVIKKLQEIQRENAMLAKEPAHHQSQK